MRYFYIFTNSPGEVFSWVKPLVERLVDEFQNPIIDVYLTPCQYSTGNEVSVCESFTGVSNVFSPFQTIKSMVSIKSNKGVVFFMGGDPFYAKRFALKTGSSLIAYSEHDWDAADFDLLITKSNNYDLMVSGIVQTSIKNRSGIVLLPGSRPEHLKVALPIMLKMVTSMDSFDVMLSPFTDKTTIDLLNKRYPNVSFIRLTNINQLSGYKFALTIPGTNTMQLAYFKVPFMMIFPSHDSSILRLNGLIGLFLLIPFIGAFLKRIILSVAIKKQRLYSMPNIRLKKQVFPELVGLFDIDQARESWEAFVSDSSKYSSILEELIELDDVSDPLDNVISFINKVS